MEEYVEDGTLRLEWRDFPYLGEESVNAAVAARSAQEQGKFWEYHNLLYENQDAGFSDETLVELAGEADLDVEEFRRDLESGRYEQVVARDFQEGQEQGISGTPTFVVSGKAIVGFQSLDTFEQVIEEAKAEAEGG